MLVIQAVEEQGHSLHGLAHPVPHEDLLLGAPHLGLPPTGQQQHGVESSVGDSSPQGRSSRSQVSAMLSGPA